MTRTDRQAEADIQRSLVRLEAAVADRPGFGHVTQSSTTRCTTGLVCETSEGGHLVHTDLARAFGGRDSAPSPGAMMRAALGSCLAMGYRLRAARYEVPLDEIVVTVDSSSVLAGMLDPGAGHPPGFTGVHVDVRVTGPAPADDIRSLIGEADRLSPMVDVVQRAIPVRHSVHTNGRRH
jgi:uncharacterized OsmC-like protein